MLCATTTTRGNPMARVAWQQQQQRCSSLRAPVRCALRQVAQCRDDSVVRPGSASFTRLLSTTPSLSQSFEQSPLSTSQQQPPGSNSSPHSRRQISARRQAQKAAEAVPQTQTKYNFKVGNSKSIWQSYKSLAPATRIKLASGLAVFALAGIFISDYVEERLRSNEEQPEQAN